MTPENFARPLVISCASLNHSKPKPGYRIEQCQLCHVRVQMSPQGQHTIEQYRVAVVLCNRCALELSAVWEENGKEFEMRAHQQIEDIAEDRLTPMARELRRLLKKYREKP